MSGVEFGIYGSDFYESKGTFILSSLGERGYSLRDGQNERSGVFKFRLRENEKAEFSSPEKYGDVIYVPISLARSACLQIEPRGIKY